MRILAPSYKRADGLLTHKIIPDVTYCVHSFEVDEYRAQGVNVLELPDSTKGNIPRVRNWLIDWAIEQGETEILLLDDDIIRLGRYFRTTGADPLEGDASPRGHRALLRRGRPMGRRSMGHQLRL